MKYLMHAGYDANDEAERLCDLVAVEERDGTTSKALELCSEVLARYPDYPRALHAKGVLFKKLGNHDEALKITTRCIELYSQYTAGITTLAGLYRISRDFEQAAALYKRALSLDPSNVHAYYGLGLLHRAEYRLNRASAMFRKVLVYDGRSVPALVGLARCCLEQGKLKEAKRLCIKALKVNSGHEEARYLLAKVTAEYGDVQYAVTMMKDLETSAEYGLASQGSILFLMQELTETTQKQIFEKTRRLVQRFLEKLYAEQLPHCNVPETNRTLRIGFVSGDLKFHPVAHHLKPLLQNIDKGSFELYAYSTSNVRDSYTEELASCFDVWRYVFDMPLSEMSNTIRLDRIDILIDLSGYTAKTGLPVFALRPAPVQMSWLGYFHTTGLRCIDYLISDALTIPPCDEPFFAEKIVRLPHSRFCYAPPIKELPAVDPLPADSNGYITFGAFTKVMKLNDKVIATWSEILKRLPDSRLILKWGTYADHSVVKAVTDRFSAQGVDLSRLEFRPKSSYRELLLQYTRDIDITLDTFPHSGGATSCESLIMGVPVVTLSGGLPISRQTHGFLRLAGLEEELVAFSQDEYVQKAVSLARNLCQLRELRACLRESLFSSPLFDVSAFARDFEELLHSVWAGWCRGRSVPKLLAQRFLVRDELHNEGLILMEQASWQVAAMYFKRILKDRPQDENALNNFGLCLWEQKALKEAQRVFTKAYALNPKNSDVVCNLAGVMIDRGQYRKALRIIRQGLGDMPGVTALYENMALAQKHLNQLGDALQSVKTAMTLGAGDSPGLTILAAGTCYEMGDMAGAICAIKKCTAMKTEDVRIYSNYCYFMNYCEGVDQKTIYDETIRNVEIFSKRNDQKTPVKTLRCDRKKSLRVGLVSADFRNHPGGVLSRAFVEYADRDAITIYCYSNNPAVDSITEVFIHNAYKWHQIDMLDDQQVVDLIRQDEIDILIDMSGHTNGNRLAVFAAKPAPVQATWVGYVNTTGLSQIDYFISDAFTTPLEMAPFFAEKLAYLPYSRFCYTPPAYTPYVTPVPSASCGHITFGCFNNLAKLSDSTIAMWAEILNRVPESKLILKRGALEDRQVKQMVRERFKQYGIAAHRLDLRGHSLHSFMLAEYGEVDIALDSMPFSGGLTSLEALWMGVPVITFVGNTPASRQTGSFLSLLGLRDLITYNYADYVENAIKLARNPARLRQMRETLRQDMIDSPLLDGSMFAENMKNLLMGLYHGTEANGPALL